MMYLGIKSVTPEEITAGSASLGFLSRRLSVTRIRDYATRQAASRVRRYQKQRKTLV